MGYERYPRGNEPQRDDNGRRYSQNYGQNDASRGYGNTGYGGGQTGGRDSYGQRDYGNQRYLQRDERYGGQYEDRGDRGSSEYHGSYASDGHRFEDVGRYAHADDDDYRQRDAGRSRLSGGQRQRDDQDRGFFERAGDEVKSWFGDEEAERRRDADQRFDERSDRNREIGHRDSDYHSWRSGQIAALDRDYHEYRQENRSRFENEFSSWRSSRQGQRDLLPKVKEHLDVVGSDGEHVGTVDKVRGDRILLTKNDADAGGRHHSIPSSWLQEVGDTVTLRKTAAEAKQHWQDEEHNQALFGDRDDSSDRERSANRLRTTTY